MRMLKIKYGKSTYQYRLDWIVCWNVLYNKQDDNNPENWEIALLFFEPGQLKVDTCKNSGRLHLEMEFEFATEAEAMAAVSIVDI